MNAKSAGEVRTRLMHACVPLLLLDRAMVIRLQCYWHLRQKLAYRRYISSLSSYPALYNWQHQGHEQACVLREHP
jgi:hypothetical protein